MFVEDCIKNIDKIKEKYREKFLPENILFKKIRRGNTIFISTGCAEPQYLVNALIEYVKSHPKSFTDTEVLHVWTLGIAPYADKKFEYNFRHNSFFIGINTREAVNNGTADYTPVFLSQLPDLLYRKLVPIDVALIQVSPPDRNGYMSLGISVDIVKAAVDNASLVIAQINCNMPRVRGDSFLDIKDVNYFIHYDEPLLEYKTEVPDEITRKVGTYVAKIVEDCDTIQVGYGSLPNAVLPYLSKKKHLGVHTELLTDGIVDLIKIGVIDNSRKNINCRKTIAAFCMGTRETYEYIHDNPKIEFRPTDYTNNPMVIARNNNMTAINSALQLDLTGQATAESLGKIFYSGIGGHADFMRGAVLSKRGKTILALESTAMKGEVSRIVPFLDYGTGVSIIRGDIHYVVTEYGIVYLHGKNIRERAMDLIAIAHPKFRPWLIEEAKKHNLIYKDQAFIPGKRGEYPEILVTFRTTKSNLDICLRPVKISDESLLKDFFYSLSDDSFYRRFISARMEMPHERLQEFVVIDYTREMIILAIIENENTEEIAGVGQFFFDETNHSAEVALVVKDHYQRKGIGTELLRYLTLLAKRQGLLGFTAEVLVGNNAMLRLFEKMGFDIAKRNEEGVYELRMGFREHEY